VALLVGAGGPAVAQSWTVPPLDSALTRRAYDLGPELERAEWNAFSAGLRDRRQPVWAGIGYGIVGLRGRTLRCPFNLSSGSNNPLYLNHWTHSTTYGASWTAAEAERQLSRAGTIMSPYHHGWWKPTTALRQLNDEMDDLDLERRAVEYERLSMVLREKASRMRKLEKALPVLVFALSTEGQVVGVAVDGARSKTKLSSRSRGLMLRALRDERFRLPAHEYYVYPNNQGLPPISRHRLEQPRPLREKLARLGLGYRVRQVAVGAAWVGRPVVLPLRIVLYRKVTRRGRCSELYTEWVPRFWGRR
jgi:hypothetical protein